MKTLAPSRTRSRRLPPRGYPIACLPSKNIIRSAKVADPVAHAGCCTIR
jgi:hypothetical protein